MVSPHLFHINSWTLNVPVTEQFNLTTGVLPIRCKGHHIPCNVCF